MAGSDKNIATYLGVDSSLKGLKLALFSREGEELASVVDLVNTASLALTLSFRELKNRFNFSVKDLEGIMVIRGPGSFTGLKVGMAFVKGLALAMDLPVVTISTLKALALTYEHLYGRREQPLICLIPLIRSEFLAAKYIYQEQELIEEAISPSAELLAGEPFKVVGGKLKPEVEMILQNYYILPEGALTRSWGKEGARLLQNKNYEEVVTMVPWYGKEPEIRKLPTI